MVFDDVPFWILYSNPLDLNIILISHQVSLSLLESWTIQWVHKAFHWRCFLPYFPTLSPNSLLNLLVCFLKDTQLGHLMMIRGKKTQDHPLTCSLWQISILFLLLFPFVLVIRVLLLLSKISHFHVSLGGLLPL